MTERSILIAVLLVMWFFPRFSDGIVIFGNKDFTQKGKRVGLNHHRRACPYMIYTGTINMVLIIIDNNNLIIVKLYLSLLSISLFHAKMRNKTLGLSVCSYPIFTSDRTLRSHFLYVCLYVCMYVT